MPLRTAPENTNAAHQSEQIKLQDEEETLYDSETAWDNYLRLKDIVLSIKLPKSASQQDELTAQILTCQRKINTIDESKLQKLLNNKANIEFFQDSPEITKQCIGQVRGVITEITKTVEAIKNHTDKTSDDIRSRALNINYVLLAITLISVAICLSVFILPLVFPALFMISIMTASLLELATKFLSPTLSVTGAILNWRNSVKNINSEINNDSWRKVGEAFSDLNGCLKEVGKMNVEILVDGLMQFDNRLEAGLRKVNANNINQIEKIEKKIEAGNAEIQRLNAETQRLILGLMSRIERVEQEHKEIKEQSDSRVPENHAAGSSHQREISPPVPRQRHEMPQPESSEAHLMPPHQSQHRRER